MGLCKKLHTKLCEGGKLTIAEARFVGRAPWPSEKKKSPKKKKSNDEFITDILKDLL